MFSSTVHFLMRSIYFEACLLLDKTAYLLFTHDQWKDYGQPEWASIAPTEGVPIEHNGRRSLFLLSEWGELVELHYTEADQRWQWINHEKPGYLV